MKALILAGGMGTRISEETSVRPKPMIEIGGRPIRIEGDKTSWKSTPFAALAQDQQLCAYRHFSFWQPMDTLRDKTMLDELWQSGRAPWRL